ncbi:MAG: hypothetical protein ACTHK7_02910 [Aureliella sp.]
MGAYLESGLANGFPIALDDAGMAQLLNTYARQIWNDLDLLVRCYGAVVTVGHDDAERLAEAEQIAYEVLPQYSPSTRLKLAKFCLKPWPITDLVSD